MSFAEVMNTTISNYIKGREKDNIIRKRKMLALLESRKRIKFGEGGNNLVWRAKSKRASLKTLGESGPLDFETVDRHDTATLPWIVYAVDDSLSKHNKLKNKGAQAIISLIETKTDDLMDDMRDEFPEKFYVDSSVAGNEEELSGFETWMGNSGALSGSKVGDPSDLYAGIYTDLGVMGSTWTGNWPDGHGPADYDYWSPLIVDYTNAGWSPTTDTWVNTCTEAMRHAILHASSNKAKLTTIMLAKDLYEDFLNSYEGDQRIRTDGTYLRKLGFSSEMTTLDGIDVTWEYGIDSGVGYGFDVDKLSLHSMQDQLFVSDQDWDIGGRKDVFCIDFHGQFRCASPRHTCKFEAITGS